MNKIWLKYPKCSYSVVLSHPHYKVIFDTSLSVFSVFVLGAFTIAQESIVQPVVQSTQI